MTAERNQAAPLAGIVVIEHARQVAAAYAGRLLSVLGATVITVEPPGPGGSLRAAGRDPADGRGPGPLFHYLSANKLFVTCEVRTRPGAALLDRLLRRADALIDDTPPAERAAIGLDADRIAREHPQLVHVSVLPFGAIGPLREHKAYELNLQHAGGEGYLMPNGLALEMFPQRPPVKIYGHFAELVGGTSAACAALAALLVQPEAGGQFVDVSVQDANVAVGCFALQRLGDGVLETRHTRSFKYGGVLECRDGYVEILTLEQRQWEGLVELMGTPDWALQPQFKDALERGRRGAEINRRLRAWARAQSADELVSRGQALNVPVAKYAEPSELLGSRQSQARGMFSPADLPGVGQAPVFTAPFQFPERPLGVRRCAAAPGTDNAEVWGEWLGLDPREIGGLVDEGVG